MSPTLPLPNRPVTQLTVAPTQLQEESRRLRFDPRPFHADVLVDKVALGHVVFPIAIFIQSSTTLYINLAKVIPLSPRKQQY
jgi:hypothetical protein